MAFSISGDDSTAATAAISALQSALATHAAQAGPHAQDLYATGTLLPLVSANAALALSLGRALYAEQIAAAKAAIAPFVTNNVERDRLTYELSVPKQLRGLIDGVASSGAAQSPPRPNQTPAF